jgi:protease-4
MTSPIPPENPGSAPHPSPGADLWSRATPAAAAADARTAASGGWERDVLEKLAFYNTTEEIDRLADVVQRLAARRRG